MVERLDFFDTLEIEFGKPHALLFISTIVEERRTIEKLILSEGHFVHILGPKQIFAVIIRKTS